MQLIDRVIGSYEQIIAAHRRKLRQPNRIVYVAGIHPAFDLDIQRLISWSIQGDNQITDPFTVRLDIDDDATPMFDTRKAAEDALGDFEDTDKPEYLVYRSFREQPLEPEANEVYMIGMDPYSRGPIRAWWRDDVAQNPTLTRAGRNERWVGSKRVLGIYNHRLRSQAAVDRALRCVVPRVSAYRYVAEIGADFRRLKNGCPVLGGSLLKVWGRGTYVVQSVPSVDPEVEPDKRFREGEEGGSGERWRPAKYVCERLKPWSDPEN